MTDEESEDRAPTAVLVEATRPAPPTADEPSDPRPGRSGRGTVVVFTAATFVSASLLFLVQPLVAKMLLPLLGGSAAVWNTASVFFQAVLLAGYAFSHLSLRHLGVRRQPVLQALVALAGLAALPIAVPAGWDPPTGSPGLWTLVVLGATVGLPFFVLSTVSPTLQRWFAATDHPSAGDPYFLYAAGNVGSLLSLLAYPLLAEPLLSSGDLSRIWSLGYATFVVLLGACWALVRRCRAVDDEVGPAPERSPLSWRTRLRWVGFAAVPSGLLLGVTRHISSDVAAMPLLWVVPLALYLTTFIVAFGRRPDRAVRVASRALKLLVVPLTLSFFGFLSSIEVGLALHLSVFTAAAMVAHGRLSLDRPGTDRLTDFYLMLSVGGVVGGATAALLAPILFSSVLEYPIFLVAALALLPRAAFTAPREAGAGSPSPASLAARARRAATPRALVLGAVVLGTAVASVSIRSAGTQRSLVAAMVVAAAGATVAYVLTRSPAGFAASIGVVLALGLLVPANATRYQSRTFYGVHRVYDDQASGGRHVLLNGSTVHGMEDVRGPHAGQPTTYYHPTGPIGRWFALHEDDGPRRVGVVGLGSGALAWYGRAGDEMDFYEIDDAVVHIAEDPDLFTFLSRSKAEVEVQVGDGRLLLDRADGPKDDALVIDAFSGDSIPAHLLTDEAVGLYLRRLADHGTLVIHISNRFFDFTPVVARLAAAHDLAAYVGFDPATPEQAAEGKLASTWVVMARTPADTRVDGEPGWTRLGEGDGPLWTDDRSDLLRLLRR